VGVTTGPDVGADALAVGAAVGWFADGTDAACIADAVHPDNMRTRATGITVAIRRGRKDTKAPGGDRAAKLHHTVVETGEAAPTRVTFILDIELDEVGQSNL
jgi:hypothetical protein